MATEYDLLRCMLIREERRGGRIAQQFAKVAKLKKHFILRFRHLFRKDGSPPGWPQ
jgi:hypothetical protein